MLNIFTVNIKFTNMLHPKDENFILNVNNPVFVSNAKIYLKKEGILCYHQEEINIQKRN